MLRFLPFSFLLILCLLWGAAQGQELRRFHKNTKVQNEGYYVVLPFETIDGHIVIEVTIDGTDYRMAFSTGSLTVISQEMFAKFRPDVVESDRALRVLEPWQRRVNLVVLQSIGLGKELLITEVLAGVADLKQDAENYCVYNGLDGILGANALPDVVYQIDYRNQQLVFTDNPARIVQPSSVVTTAYKTNDDNCPVVRGGDDGKKWASFVMETDAEEGIVLPSAMHEDFARRTDMPALKGKVHLYGLPNNLTRPEPVRLQPMRQFGFEGETLGPAIVRFVGQQEQGLLGMDFLQDYIITVDPINKIIHWVRHRPSKEAITFRSFGFEYRLIQGRLVVTSIFDGSAAQQAGMRVGSVLTAIDGLSAVGMSFEDYCSIRRQRAELVQKDVIRFSFEQYGLEQSLELEARNLIQY